MVTKRYLTFAYTFMNIKYCYFILCLKVKSQIKDKDKSKAFYPKWFQRSLIIYYYFIYVYVKSQHLINLYFIITKL